MMRDAAADRRYDAGAGECIPMSSVRIHVAVRSTEMPVQT